MGEARSRSWIWTRTWTTHYLPQSLDSVFHKYFTQAPDQPCYQLLDNMEVGKDTEPLGRDVASTRSASQEEHGFDPALDGLITRKVDLRLVPVLLVMFMLAYLDRSNLGNAKIQGLEHDLHMEGRDYNVASLIFYISYIVFEVPSNLILAKVAPSTWLSALLFLWGKPVYHLKQRGGISHGRLSN